MSSVRILQCRDAELDDRRPNRNGLHHGLATRCWNDHSKYWRNALLDVPQWKTVEYSHYQKFLLHDNKNKEVKGRVMIATGAPA